jgi:hypothetical protein
MAFTQASRVSCSKPENSTSDRSKRGGDRVGGVLPKARYSTISIREFQKAPWSNFPHRDLAARDHMIDLVIRHSGNQVVTDQALSSRLHGAIAKAVANGVP